MKYYLIAGEASGDLHASNLMHALKKQDPDASFRYYGGDLMQKQGGTLVKHYRELAYMGFIPVLLHARTILKNLDLCRKDIKKWMPDVVILVDYPGFNLKIAKYVKKKLAIPVYYYISPKIWAWKKWRIKDIRKYVDRMFSILPFEVPFYQGYNYEIDYVGNPTVDAVSDYRKSAGTSQDFFADNALDERPIIAILAGSRRQEIKDNLPVMLQAVSDYPAYQPVIAGAPGIEKSFYGRFTAGKDVKIVSGQTYPLLDFSVAALVTSGTATLETALFRVPQVVCYNTELKTIYTWVFDHFFPIQYISLVNLIAGKTVVKELFAHHFKLGNIKEELGRILNDAAYRKKMQEEYDKIISLLGEAGASEKSASLMVGYLSHTS